MPRPISYAVFCLKKKKTVGVGAHAVHVSSSLHTLSLSFFFYCYAPHPDLLSFPTRRSSDLMVLMPLLSRLLTLLVILTMPLFLARLTLIPIKSLSICFRVI